MTVVGLSDNVAVVVSPMTLKEYWGDVMVPSAAVTCSGPTKVPVTVKPPSVPIVLPTLRNTANGPVSALAVAAIATEAATTTVECPSEKKNPTDTGRFPSCISLRVTLSIAAI